MSVSRYFREAKYALAILFAIIVCGVIAINNLITQPVRQQANQAITTERGPSILAHVKFGNIFAPYLSEPFETMIFLAKNGKFYSFTTRHERLILVPPAYACEYLRRAGIEPRDIVIIIHNHLFPGPFSPGDDAFYHYFRRQGFRGAFVIYYPFSGETLLKED